MNKHIPTPWKFKKDLIRSSDEVYVAKTAAPTDEEAEANAAFIVRAVNNFEPMLKGLKMAVGRMSDIDAMRQINSDEVIDALGVIINEAGGKS